MNIDLMIYLLGNYEELVFLIGLFGLVNFLTFILTFECTTGIKQTRMVKIVHSLAFFGSFAFVIIFLVPTQETMTLWLNEEIENTYTPEQIASSDSLQRKIAYVRKNFSHSVRNLNEN